MEQPPRYVQNTLSLSINLRNPYMALSKLLELGMPKWIAFSLTLVFRDLILTPMSIPRKQETISSLVLYVDDLILTSTDPKLITHVKSSLKQNFEISDLGHLHYFLGLQVLQTKEGFKSQYYCDILRRFHMEDCKPAPSPFQSRVKLSATSTFLEVDATLYRHLVGSLLYLTFSS